MGQERPSWDDVDLMLEARAGEQVSLLEALVRHETPTGDARRIRGFADLLARRWSGLGARCDLVACDGGAHLRAELRGEGGAADEAPVLLVTHSDTVHPVGTLDEDLPWSVQGDTARGPGVYDMKGGIVVVDSALRALVDGRMPRRPVTILVVADEEIGSPAGTELVRTSAPGHVGAIGFESPHPDGALKLGRYGSTRLRVTVRGRAAHAALDPEAGVSAIEELLDVLVEVRAVVDEANRRGAGSVLCNIGTIGGGGRTNVVPAEAYADLGLRFRDPTGEHHVLTSLSGIAPRRPQARVALTTLSSRPAWSVGEADRAWYEALERRAGGLPPARSARGGADTNTLGALGLPTIDGFGPRGGGAHALSEHVVLSSILERSRYLTRILAA